MADVLHGVNTRMLQKNAWSVRLGAQRDPTLGHSEA
jgi:hypothetical protein